MKITQEWLVEKSACKEGREWFLSQGETDGVKVVEKLMAEDRLDWASWLVVRIMNRPQYIGYAVFAAEQVLGIFEERYPDDKRPRQAIEAAKQCIVRDTPENRSSAAAAAYAAADYAAAAYAAAAAAYADAYAAADAAYAAAADAAYAAYAAADNTRKDMKARILNHGLNLLKEEAQRWSDDLEVIRASLRDGKRLVRRFLREISDVPMRAVD
jgi:hypothetical protein